MIAASDYLTPAAPAPASELAGGEPASLRERKKLATRRTLRRVALDLVSERGFAHVTVEDIAEAANVSPRTFFNYFPSKEAVLFGTGPDRIEAVREGILHAAPGESALAALRIVLAAEARRRAEDLRELGGDPASWLRRMKSSHADPHLRAAQAAHLAMGERVVAEAVAQRLGTDPDKDPYPLLLAAAATAITRATLTFWATSGGEVSLDQLTSLACEALAAGLPENCALRRVTTHTARSRDGKDEH
ncbi:MAG: TetR family transcriptional regulator [Streptosporangiaceae bacterium]